MSTADFAVASDRALMFAGIVYVLALFSHILEWATTLRAPAAVPVAVGASGASTESSPESAADTVRAERIDLFGRVGISLTVLAALLHLAGLVSRSLATSPARVPWGNMYEFSVTGTFGVVLIYLVLLKRYQLRWMGLFVTAFVVVVLMLANLALTESAGPLVPALHSYWLVIHVGAAITATGAFSVGAMASVMFLVKDSAERRGASSRVLAAFPSTEALDRVAYRLNAVGFPIWTFAALVAGPIWAQYAWGSYWNWDPKEVWAFITWVVYAAYLHARATAGWRGRAASAIALVAFATLLFNFVGINFFFGAGSMHSYAGH